MIGALNNRLVAVCLWIRIGHRMSNTSPKGILTNESRLENYIECPQRNKNDEIKLRQLHLPLGPLARLLRVASL